ncbi:hypothetical protein PENTCL1PPCAC_7631, partial [Pristionchus entomophagus]
SMHKGSLAIAKQWQKMSFELSGKSNDGILSLFTKVFETMAILHSEDSDRKNIHCALRALDSQQAITMDFEDPNSDSIRTLVFGLMQCLHGTLTELIEKIHSLQREATVDQSTQTDEFPPMDYV